MCYSRLKPVETSMGTSLNNFVRNTYITSLACKAMEIYLYSTMALNFIEQQYGMGSAAVEGSSLLGYYAVSTGA